MLAVVALISFIFTLNEFVIAQRVLQTNDHFTLPVGMQRLHQRTSTARAGGRSPPASLLAAIPVIALFLFAAAVDRRAG